MGRIVRESENPSSGQGPAPILFTLYDFAPSVGGVQTMFREAARGISGPVTVVCAEGESADADRGFDEAEPYAVHRLPLRRRTLLDRIIQKLLILIGASFAGFHVVMLKRAFFPLLRMTRHGAFPAIHCAYHFLAAPALAVARIRGIPLVLFVHGNEFLKMKQSRFERWLLRRAKRVFVLSDFALEQCALLGVRPGRARRIPIGIPAQAPRNRAALRDKWGASGRRVVLTLCRMEERKGVDFVLRALAELRSRVPDLLYLVAGDGSSRPEFERLATELLPAESVRFFGRVTDEEKDELFALCDLFVLVPRVIPDQHEIEGFGIVYLEAASHGIPSIGTWSGGVPSAVLHEKTGLLVPPDDQTALAGALSMLLTEDDLREAMGRRARDRVRREFRWERFEEAIRQPGGRSVNPAGGR